MAGEERKVLHMLLSLIGQLQHTGCIVRPSRTFLSRMIITLNSGKGTTPQNTTEQEASGLTYSGGTVSYRWHRHVLGSGTLRMRSHNGVRCIRNMGVWYIFTSSGQWSN